MFVSVIKFTLISESLSLDIIATMEFISLYKLVLSVRIDK